MTHLLAFIIGGALVYLFLKKKDKVETDIDIMSDNNDQPKTGGGAVIPDKGF